MKLSSYIRDKIGIILLFVAVLFSLDLYLIFVGNESGVVILISIFLCISFVLGGACEFLPKRKFYNEIDNCLQELDKKYLISEIISEPNSYEGQLIRGYLRKSNKSVIEAINSVDDDRKEYKEYIESWIHEVKTPITAIKLLCENNTRNTSADILNEVSIIDKQVENILYYARADEVYKDYIIHKINLGRTIRDVILQFKRLFISAGMRIEVSDELDDIIVSSDEKWIAFIIGQFFSNSIKYRSEEMPMIRICSFIKDNSVVINIEDNGMGISEIDISRVFDKSYTGDNGRNTNQATGMGLYLAKKLCNRLGIGLSCESELRSYTRIIMVFPDSQYNEIFQ